MSNTSVGGKLLTQWRCPECHKYLSSKRSYREHLNVHEKVRPFQCEQCNYAAASQMTLRRHRLRSHIPRSDWGYPCPYCTEIYMEPASYQQHVSHRHFGLSCTFGCPHKSCNFTSKCTKSFIEHVNKHLVIIPADTNESVDEFDDIYSPSKINPMKYLVDDEIGSGYGRAPREAQIKRYPDVLSLAKNKTTSKQISTKSTIISKSSTNDIRQHSTRIMTKNQKVQETFKTESDWQNEEDYEEVYCAPQDFKQEVVDEEPQLFKLVDENGACVDNQIYYYELDPEEEYEVEDGWDYAEVEQEKSSEPKIIIKIPKEDERRLPDGQIDIDLD